MDLASVLGLFIGFLAVVGGNALEGGKISQITQPNAFIIVIGGTIGATMLQFPLHTLLDSVKSAKSVFANPADPAGRLIDEIVSYATTARKEGILALEPLASKASDPFLARALMMAVDGADSAAMRSSLEASIHQVEESGEDQAKVYETAGGYAPTVGIIGAVLGLIQVMSNLSDVSKVGHGIASAFVATVYGVAFANLICLPIGGKLKLRTRESVAVMELMLEGALAIQEGMNPKLIRERLNALRPHHGGGKAHAGAGEPAAAAA